MIYTRGTLPTLRRKWLKDDVLSTVTGHILTSMYPVAETRGGPTGIATWEITAWYRGEVIPAMIPGDLPALPPEKHLSSSAKPLWQ